MKATTASRSVLFIMILCVIAVAFFYITLEPPQIRSGVTPSNASTSVSYRDLPLSEHAKTAHANQLWNAPKIQNYFAKGKCVPKIYLCEAQDYEIHTCSVNPGKSIALVIGHTMRQIITGFMDDTSTWNSKCPTALN